jgi:drug/metabolite transporter (DMT)-like permease
MPARLQLHLVVFLLALTGIIAQWISLPAPALVAWRTLIASVAAAAWIGLRRGGPLMPGWKPLLRMLGIGLIIGAHWMCFFGSIRLSNVSIALAGFATTSVFTAFTEPLIERRRIRPFEILLGLLVLGGLSLVAGNVRGEWDGLGVGLLGAVLAAIFPVFNRRLVLERHHPMTMVVWEMAGACLICAAVSAFACDSAEQWIPDASDLGWLLVLALLCTVFAHGWHIRLLRSLSAYTSNLAINFEPVYGMLMAAWLFREHESLTLGFYTGSAAIILANLLHPLGLRWARRRQGPLSERSG